MNDYEKTYAETQNKPPFDWNAFFRKTKYSQLELDEATALAGSWVTCACGNQCAVIPRYGDAPTDNILRNLGVKFVGVISAMRFWKSMGNPFEFAKEKKQAKKILEEIEDRSRVLIDEIYQKELFEIDLNRKYCEAEKEPVIDWNAFLKKPTYTLIELCDAEWHAKSWVTCACGNQCAVIPRDVMGAPLDDKLGDLGCKFADAISDILTAKRNKKSRQKAVLAAKKTLKQIERRSDELITEIKLTRK